MKHYAVTGNIGSGKTTACRIFEFLGIKIFYADQKAHEAYLLPKVKRQMLAKFGKEIYKADSSLNRPLLTKEIFGNSEKLAFVNALIHPQVQQMYEKWKRKVKDTPYTIYEAAILFETGRNKDFDAVIYVTADEELRIKRVMQRSNLSREQVLKRINEQWTDAQKAPLADYILENEETKLLIPQILALHHELIKQSTNS